MSPTRLSSVVSMSARGEPADAARSAPSRMPRGPTPIIIVYTKVLALAERL
jgi:hypothetical protein